MKLKYSKPKKVKRSTLKNKADKLFSQIVRSWGKCELAGLDKIKCSNVLQTMHIETRGVLAIRWNLMNALCGCSGHHVYYTNNPRAFNELVAKHFPLKAKFVEEHCNDHMTEDLEDVIRRLKVT